MSTVIPPKGKSKGRPATYTFYALPVGGHEDVPPGKRATYAACAYAAKKAGKGVFKLRTVEGVLKIYRKS